MTFAEIYTTKGYSVEEVVEEDGWWIIKSGHFTDSPIFDSWVPIIWEEEDGVVIDVQVNPEAVKNIQRHIEKYGRFKE